MPRTKTYLFTYLFFGQVSLGFDDLPVALSANCRDLAGYDRRADRVNNFLLYFGTRLIQWITR
jgi:hypothetical protein